MAEPVPTYAQYAYAILHAKFASDSFSPDYLHWFVSKTMTKKILHVLEKAGWIVSVERGVYKCMDINEIFEGMIQFRVPELLKKSDMKYSYSDASAAEIWTDYTYIQRSWEHSPYYIRVLKSDAKRWVSYLRKHRIKAFVGKAMPSFGEFTVLEPCKELRFDIHNDLPVEPLTETVEYCEKHVDSFEYHLAYMHKKFGIKTAVKIDKRIIAHAQEAIA